MWDHYDTEPFDKGFLLTFGLTFIGVSALIFACDAFAAWACAHVAF